MRRTRGRAAALILTVTGLVAGMPAAAALAAGSPPVRSSVIYSSLAGSPAPGNLPSEGAEAYAFRELGNEVTFAGTHRVLTSVEVTLSSWACVSGSWYAGDCKTPQGATFQMPLTLNIYKAVPGSSVPGALITSVTQTFSIPYRPSASPAQCAGSADGAGAWYQPSTGQCFNGLDSNITFRFGGQGVSVPNEIVYGIAYNTTHYGYQPIGSSAACYSTPQGCPYDSLNIALTEDPVNVTAGSDPNPGTVWQNSPYGSEYCDGGTAGINVFRMDSPEPGKNCWSVNYTATGPYYPPYYVPAVQFKASTSG